LASPKRRQYLHCGPKAVFLEDHPDFIKRDKDGKALNAAWAFPALNYANPQLREYLWKNMEWWTGDFAVDGFRCDVADGIPLDFWETARARLEKIRPDVGMLAEGTRKADQLKAFDLDYSWGSAFKEWDNAAMVRKLWETMRNERPKGGAKFIRFIDNHDIANDDWANRIETRWGAAKVHATLVALFTLDGVPFLYNGQEVADTARHSIFGRLPIDWANIALVNTPGGTLTGLAARRVAGKPYTVSEYNHPAPNQYVAEGFPMIAAFGAFQGWDGVFSFDYYVIKPRPLAV
jgi:glycosidase